jgi:hypothetical protein
MKIFEYTLLTGGDMSGDLTSPSQQLTFMVCACIQAVFTGSPSGTLKLQISNDNINWSDYTGSSSTVSGAGNFAWIITDIGYPWIRVTYNPGSGSGSLNITINGKGF